MNGWMLNIEVNDKVKSPDDAGCLPALKNHYVAFVFAPRV